MPSNYWIKLYHEIIDDPKMMKMSEVLFSRCIKLFLLAGDHGQGGELPPLEDAAWRLRIPEEELESDLIELQRVGITSHQDGVWSIVKWDERQGPMSSTERVRRHRARKQRQRHIREYKKRGPADVRFGNDDETGVKRSVTQDSEEIQKRRDKEADEEEIRGGGAQTRMAEVIQSWEKAGGPITPMIAEDLEDLADEFEQHRRKQPEGADGADTDGAGWVIAGIQEASRSARGPINTKFLQAILDRWKQQGFQSPFRKSGEEDVDAVLDEALGIGANRGQR